MSKLKTAINLAKMVHAGQKDLAGVDYFNHPQTVASLVKGKDAKIVAYLHDTVEDTYVTIDLLRMIGFSKKIIDAVIAITHIKNDGYKEPYADYIKRVKKNKLATKVKIADMIHNSDLTRLPQVTQKDIKRSVGYLMYIRYLQGETTDIQ